MKNGKYKLGFFVFHFSFYNLNNMANDKKPVAQQQHDAIMANLRNKNYKPIYILMGTKDGTESYFIDSISQYIADNVLAPEERDFNQVIF